jgi:predicted alpha/beta-fold hydrolase
VLCPYHTFCNPTTTHISLLSVALLVTCLILSVLFLFVLLPGGSHEGYVKWACVAAASRGWRAVVLNMRGCNGLPLTSARGYNAINTADLHVAVQSIHR